VPTEHFKSAEAYRKYRAYTHIHGIPTHAKNVVVAGNKHKVVHRSPSSTSKRKTRRKAPRKKTSIK
jgi:hypothetical protein